MTLRSWATPLAIGTFLIMGVTGGLMFFHANTTANKLIHEFAGLAMIVAVLAHVVLNWRAFQTYFKRTTALALMGLSALLLGLTFVPGLAPAPEGMRPDLAFAAAAARAPISDLAALVDQSPDIVLAAIKAQGHDATSDQTIADLVGDKLRDQMGLLGAVAQAK